MLIKDFICDKGLKRKVNEDSYIIHKDEKFIIVSDGMGGHERGDIASKIIIKIFNEILNNFVILQNNLSLVAFKKNILHYLNIACSDSTARITDYANRKNIKTTVGATIAGIFFDKLFDKLVVFHLGDSRVYQIRDNKISQITKDHSVYNNSRQVLKKAIGNFKVFEIDVSFIDYKKDDILLVCTDGVTNYISDEEILNIINTNTNNYCDKIKEVIYNNGASDNLTLVVSQIG